MSKIFINIRPKAAPRPRFSKNGTYNTAEYTNYKKAIALICSTKFKKLDTPITMRIEFFFKIPKSWSKKKKENVPYHASKPDVDNLVKSIKDALNGVAYIDDSQVFSLFATKQYAENDGVMIEIIGK